MRSEMKSWCFLTWLPKKPPRSPWMRLMPITPNEGCFLGSFMASPNP